MTLIAFLSDLHEFTPDIRDVDMAVFCGDFAFRPHGDIKGEVELWKNTYSKYFWELTKRGIRTLAIPGNHDFCGDNYQYQHILADCFDRYNTYGTVELLGFKFMTFCFCRLEDWACFATDEAQAKKVDWILRNKNNVDFLITHSPPFSFMSKSDWGSFHVERLLCEVRPKHLHAFGHVHETRGIGRVDELTLLNCAYVDKDYRPIGYYYVYDTETKTLTTRKG